MSQSQGDPKHVQIALTQQLGIVAAVVRRIKVLMMRVAQALARRIPAVLTDTVLTLSTSMAPLTFGVTGPSGGFSGVVGCNSGRPRFGPSY